MATHFARGILNRYLLSTRLSTSCHNTARQLPEHRRTRFIASRALLAELLFMLYGVDELPEIVTLPDGRPAFAEASLPHFSIAYAGNIVGIALTTEGECGLDIELQHASGSVYSPLRHPFTSNENLWINNQHDPDEARRQLLALRQSVLKLTGNVDNDSPDILQLLPGSGRLRSARLSKIEAICDVEDVLIWSVAASPALEQLTLWEYDEKLGWRSLADMQTRARDPDSRLMRFTSLPAEKALILNQSQE